MQMEFFGDTSVQWNLAAYACAISATPAQLGFET